MEQSIEQLQSLRVIEHLDVVIFSVERGMPASPTVIDTVKKLYDVIVREYNEKYAGEREAQPESTAVAPASGEKPEQD
jgi:hypothetical protein